jgi:hypothetical protein
MNVQLRKGGVVHYTGSEHFEAPACNPWKGSAGYREVKDEVTCRKCLTRMAKYAEAPEVDEAEAPAAEFNEDVHVVGYSGGKVHSAMPGMPESHPYPLCRGGGQNNRVTKFRETDAPLTCATCITYAERRAAAAEIEETTMGATPEHDEATCRDLDCATCFPPYVPQVGDRIEDDHTASLGQIRTVVGIRGHLAEIKIEGPMFHAAHYGQEELNEDGTFTRVALRKAPDAAPAGPKLAPTQQQLIDHARQFGGIVYKPSGMATATANRAVAALHAAGLVESPWIGTRLTEAAPASAHAQIMAKVAKAVERGTLPPAEERPPSDCLAAHKGELWHARQFNAFWTICGQDVQGAETSDIQGVTCPHCKVIIREDRPYARKPKPAAAKGRKPPKGRVQQAEDELAKALRALRG